MYNIHGLHVAPSRVRKGILKTWSPGAIWFYRPFMGQSHWCRNFFL